MAFHEIYLEIEPTDIPFAQDCLGDQYLLRQNKVIQLYADTGEVEELNMDFDEFINECIEDPVEFLSLEPLLQFESEGGVLMPGELLHVYPLFSMEESEEGVAISKRPMFEQNDFLAGYYKKHQDN